MRIRTAGEPDYPQIADLWFRSWLSTGAKHGEGVTRAVLQKRLRDEPWEMWVVDRDRSFAAFLAIDRKEKCLSQLFVAPKYQNREIGLRLLEHAKREMPDGFWLRTDEGNSKARRFYERHDLQFNRIEDRRAYYTWRL